MRLLLYHVCGVRSWSIGEVSRINKSQGPESESRLSEAFGVQGASLGLSTIFVGIKLKSLKLWLPRRHGASRRASGGVTINQFS